MARDYVPVPGRAGHRAQSQQQLKVLHLCCGSDPTTIKCFRKVCKVGDELSRRLRTFGVQSSQEQDLSRMVRVANEAYRCKGIACGQSLCRRNVGCRFTRSRMHILDKLPVRVPVVDKAEIQLIVEQSGPWIGERTANENKIVVCIQLIQPQIPRRAHNQPASARLPCKVCNLCDDGNVHISLPCRRAKCREQNSVFREKANSSWERTPGWRSRRPKSARP
jgi:hypothetical protein